MSEKGMRIMSEKLARAMDRRSFIKQAGTVAFAGMAALASGHLLPAFASAGAGRQPPIPTVPACAPPGPYCNLNGINEPNACHGASCYQHMFQGEVLQCHAYGYGGVGCWTTAVLGGYWVCCDCACPTSSGSSAFCGCAQFSGSPMPRPDLPDGGEVR